MGEKVDILVEQARMLSAAERLDLIDRLLDGLEPAVDDIASAWARVAEERLESVRRGEMPTLDADEALADARARLAKARRLRRTG